MWYPCIVLRTRWSFVMTSQFSRKCCSCLGNLWFITIEATPIYVNWFTNVLSEFLSNCKMNVPVYCILALVSESGLLVALKSFGHWIANGFCRSFGNNFRLHLVLVFDNIPPIAGGQIKKTVLRLPMAQQTAWPWLEIDEGEFYWGIG